MSILLVLECADGLAAPAFEGGVHAELYRWACLEGSLIKQKTFLVEQRGTYLFLIAASCSSRVGVRGGGRCGYIRIYVTSANT